MSGFLAQIWEMLYLLEIVWDNTGENNRHNKYGIFFDSQTPITSSFLTVEKIDLTCLNFSLRRNKNWKEDIAEDC